MEMRVELGKGGRILSHLASSLINLSVMRFGASRLASSDLKEKIKKKNCFAV